MTCPTGDDWTLASMDLLAESRADELREHLEGCNACRERYNEARRGHVELLRTYEALDRDHDAGREQLMASLPLEAPAPATAGRRTGRWRRLGDFVMSLNSTPVRRAAVILAPVACIVIAVAIFLTPAKKSAFAAAIEHFRRTKIIACRVTITAQAQLTADPQAGPLEADPSPADGFNETQVVRAKLYLSDAHGVRRDAYEDDVPVSTAYTSDNGSTLVLNRKDRTYQETEVDDELVELAAASPGPDIHFMSLAGNPHRLLRGLRNLTVVPHRELGRESFEGRELIGYEIDGEKVGLGPPLTDPAEETRAELWVDAKTRIVSRLVFHVVTSVPRTRDLPLSASFAMTIEYDRFDWDPSLPADWFAAVVPDGYTRRADGMPERLKMPDESALIEALRVFNDLAGRYPSSLNAMNVGHEVGFLMGVIQAKRNVMERSGHGDPEIPDLKSFGEKLQGLGLYTLLEMKGRRPKYFGDKVTAEDADMVLLRWNLDNGQVRVIYGDLHVETATASDVQR